MLFEKSFVEDLDKHVPKKRKVFLGNQNPHVKKTLRSVIMKGSKLKTKATKFKLKNDVTEYKKEFFDNLETKSNSKRFWSTFGHLYFSNKHAKCDADILLIECNKILPDNGKVATVFSNYFQSITKKP